MIEINPVKHLFGFRNKNNGSGHEEPDTALTFEPRNSKYVRQESEAELSPLTNVVRRAMEEIMYQDAIEAGTYSGSFEEYLKRDATRRAQEEEAHLGRERVLYEQALAEGYHRPFSEFLVRDETLAEQQSNFDKYEANKQLLQEEKRKKWEAETAAGTTTLTFEEYDNQYEKVDLASAKETLEDPFNA